MHKTQNSINTRHTIKPLDMQKITFYDNRGRIETADMHTVVFSDGVERLICTHHHIPDEYLPKDVYTLNEESKYVAVGSYTINETKSTQWFNAYANVWQGSPSIKSYIFHEN
jgi:hypothetical protein